jgi:hypothetical protein
MSRSVIQRTELEGRGARLRQRGDRPVRVRDDRPSHRRRGPERHRQDERRPPDRRAAREQGWVSRADRSGRRDRIDVRQGRRRRRGAARAPREARSPIVVVSAEDASEFIPYGRAILEAADQDRKPIFVMMDEGQVFSAPKKREGRHRRGLRHRQPVRRARPQARARPLPHGAALHRLAASLDLRHKNLSLIGCQEDPTAWAALAPQFKASKIEFGDLAGARARRVLLLQPRGVEKIRMPMAEALKRVAPKAKAIKPKLPTTFSQWDRAMREIPTPRLRRSRDPVVAAARRGRRPLAAADALRHPRAARRARGRASMKDWQALRPRSTAGRRAHELAAVLGRRRDRASRCADTGRARGAQEGEALRRALRAVARPAAAR